jgi:hypothetical protein
MWAFVQTGFTISGSGRPPSDSDTRPAPAPELCSIMMAVNSRLGHSGGGRLQAKIRASSPAGSRAAWASGREYRLPESRVARSAYYHSTLVFLRGAAAGAGAAAGGVPSLRPAGTSPVAGRGQRQTSGCGYPGCRRGYTRLVWGNPRSAGARGSESQPPVTRQAGRMAVPPLPHSARLEATPPRAGP